MASAAGASIPAREAPPPAALGSGQPFLAPDAGGVWMSWTEPVPGGGHRVAAAFFDGAGGGSAASVGGGNVASGAGAEPGGDGGTDGRWSAPVTIAQGRGFFVNWADFPSIHVFGELLVAHWLQRGGGGGTYDYGVRLAWSQDRGATWSEPWTPHEDGTPTEHGFVSVFEAAGPSDAAGAVDAGRAPQTGERAPAGGWVWAAWLDGRAMVEPGGPMSLRARAFLPVRDGQPTGPTLPAAGSVPAPAADAGPGPEELLDDRVCECCQTDAVVAAGVPVVVFRDRGEGELRNIHVARRLPDGWTESVHVHDDGWVVGGCPVNGPAMAERDGRVVVAWFSAPAGEARVHVAFSSDGGGAFGPAFRIDAGQPAGRVDVVALDDGSALATWLEREEGGAAAIVSRRLAPDGTAGALRTLAASSEDRASGFPRIARLGTDRLVLAWTAIAGDQSQVRAAVFDLEAWDAPS